MNKDSITNLFLRATYFEQLDFYNKLLDNSSIKTWDVIVITASNKKQASIYEQQLKIRKESGLLVSQCDFIVVPDKDDKRIGSGGATLNVIKILKEKYSNIDDLKILLIHSGGDSKRIPQYSASGKLFSPVPRELIPGFSSTLFDELLIMFSNVPSRMDAGLLAICGDALPLFNVSQLDLQYSDLSSITMKAEVDEGVNHGVIVEKNNSVLKFLHKCDRDNLVRENAVINGLVNIDTGIVYFSSKLLNDLYEITINNYSLLVNEDTRLNLYGDLLYPFALSSTLKDYYKQSAEITINNNILKARDIIWSLKDKYLYKIIKLSPAKFIHFGTSWELFDLMVNEINHYAYLGWKRITNSSDCDEMVCFVDSRVSGTKFKSAFIEKSIITNCNIGENVILSNNIINNKEIPSNVCISTIKTAKGFVSRIYGINDDPKKVFSDTFLGFDIHKVSDKYGKLFDETKTLWEQDLYLYSSSNEESVVNALDLYKIFSLTADDKIINKFISGEKTSLKDSFNNAIATDTSKIFIEVLYDKVMQSINNKLSLDDLCDYILKTLYSKKLAEYINCQIDGIDSLYVKIRLNYVLYKISKELKYYNRIFSLIKGQISTEYEKNKITFQTIKDFSEVYLPVRINLAGGWSDTPPYCIDNGGKVLNTAVSLNGNLPIHVRIERIKEKKLIIESSDLGVIKEFYSSKDIYNCQDPNDSFALVKSGLVITGFVLKNDYKFENLFKCVGGGVKIITDVQNIPKGSGLGTSSILSGALIKALYDFMNIAKTNEDISNDVLKVEQLMSTGGGWQDQVGGIFPGVKIIESKPGISQELKIKKLSLSFETVNSINKRFLLINTGQRRLARNLLRDIVLKYISNDKITLNVLSSIKTFVQQEADLLLNGDIDNFADLLDQHWNLIKKMDPGCTNLCIDTIIKTIENEICGKTIIGAGGGGFILVVLKAGSTKSMVEKNLFDVFGDTDIKVYDVAIVD